MDPERISYTAKDYNTLKEELLNLVPQLTDDWTDFRESDIGVVLIELMASLGDMIFYSIDKEVLENYLIVAREKRNIRNKLKSIGYKIPSYRSAKVEVEFSTLHVEDIKIPKYTIVSTEEGEEGKIEYVTNEEELILPAESSVIVECVQGVRYDYNYDQENIDEKNRIRLEDNDIAEETVNLFIDGTEWELVDDVILHVDTGRYFSLEYDKEDNVFVKLYPGWENLVYDEDNINIKIIYLRSLGEDGMIGSYMIKNVENELYDVLGNEVSGDVEVVNYQKSTGGEDPQSIDEAKRKGTDLVKTMWSAVTLNDFEVLSNNYPGVANSLAVDWSISEEEELKATASIGSGDNGTITIEVEEPGSDGNNYTVEVIDNSGTPDVDLNANLSNYDLTVDLATDSSGNLDASVNTASNIAAEIGYFSQFNTFVSGDGSGVFNEAEIVEFTGGFAPSGPYEVDLYIVPEGGGVITDLLRSNLQDYLGERKTATLKVNIKNTIYHSIDIDVNVYVRKGVDLVNMENRVKEELDLYFSYESRSYSELIGYSELVRVIEDVSDNILRVQLNEPESNVLVPYGRFPILGETFIDMQYA